MWNRALHITGWVVGVVGLFVLLGAAVSSSNHAYLRDIAVDIDFGDEAFFITNDQVTEVVTDLGYMIDSAHMADIDPGRIEHILENNAFISDAEVYKELNGVLHVDVDVRQPVLRVYNLKGESIYLDEDGVFMPLNRNYTARTPIANGYITIDMQTLAGVSLVELAEQSEHPDVAHLQSLYDIVKACRANSFWKAQFNQYYVNADREIEMIPRVGDHNVLVGSANNIGRKLNKLRMFYEKGLNKTGWNEYKVINLKYANQVVCTKS